MGEKIPISYLALGLYITFVVVSTLLVGLLPPLVNPPICDPPKTSKAPKTGELAELSVHDTDTAAVVKHIPDAPAPIRKRRSIDKPTKEAILDFEARQKRAREALENEMKNNEAFVKLMGSRVPIPQLKECPEIQQPLPLVDYPWYETRLPSSITPVNYKIELLLDNLDLNIYDGFIDVTFNVNQPSTYLLLHNGIDDHPIIESFKDRNGNNVELACIGNFPYLRNDYFIIKPEQQLTPAQAPYTVRFLFLDFYSGEESGIYKLDYGPDADESKMFLSKFRPIDARRAYPSFDEPGMRATYDVTILHKPHFTAVFNTPVKSTQPDPNIPDLTQTIFEQTPPMPTDYIALSVFKTSHFGSVSARTTRSNIPINLWARKEYIDGGFGADPLAMSVRLFDALDDIFDGVGAKALPPKIDILLVPKYPVSGIGHFGLPIAEEDAILFKKESASEKDKQQAALLMAKMLSEFWFGNFISQRWWDELWTQEGFVQYVIYRVVDEAFPEYNVLDQFIPGEQIETIIMDGYPSSHPIQKTINNAYEIEEYFDQVETSKTASILRMLENEFTIAEMYTALENYLNANPWGVADIQVFYNSFQPFGNNWSVKDFFDRWTLQSNYPLLQVELVSNAGVQSVKFTQSRGLNTNDSIFSGEVLYPSPWDFVWYLPIECSFGSQAANGGAVREREYYLDTKEGTFNVPNEGGVTWTWVHCDRKFTGFYELQYTPANWYTLGAALKAGNFEFLPEDRAQIIHNVFLNAFTERGSYYTVRSILEYLPVEFDYLPWRTLHIHIDYLSRLLIYRKSFYELSEFIAYNIRPIELGIDTWNNADGSHVEELLKETIINLACSMQDPFCIANVTLRWPQALQILQSANFENAPIQAYGRGAVYNYHMENTYDVNDWDLIYRDFLFSPDLPEHNRLVTSLTYSRLPWLLFRILNGVSDEYLEKTDFFKIATTLTQKPLGRELVWDKYRMEFNQLIEKYGEDDARMGWLLIEVAESFETEFLFYELLSFVFFTSSGATANARFRALEVVSTNLVWLEDKEDEVRCAFSLRGCLSKNENPLLTPIKEPKSFAKNARAAFLHKLKESDLEIFADMKKKLIKN